MSNDKDTGGKIPSTVIGGLISLALTEGGMHFSPGYRSFIHSTDKALFGSATAGVSNILIDGALGYGLGEGLHYAWGKMFSRSGRQTSIEGLRHGGSSQAMRKRMTDFGSGWQGLPEGFEISWRTGFRDKGFIGTLKHNNQPIGFLQYSQEGQSATMQDIKITGMVKPGMSQAERQAAAEAYQGKKLGQAAYKEAFSHAKERGAVEFTSDVRGTTSEMAKARIWESRALAPIVERKGSLYKADLTQLHKLGASVMKSGEGAAIGKAGTAEVPALVRAGARIIRNAL